MQQKRYYCYAKLLKTSTIDWLLLIRRVINSTHLSVVVSLFLVTIRDFVLGLQTINHARWTIKCVTLRIIVCCRCECIPKHHINPHCNTWHRRLPRQRHHLDSPISSIIHSHPPLAGDRLRLRRLDRKLRSSRWCARCSRRRHPSWCPSTSRARVSRHMVIFMCWWDNSIRRSSIVRWGWWGAAGRRRRWRQAAEWQWWRVQAASAAWMLWRRIWEIRRMVWVLWRAAIWGAMGRLEVCLEMAHI